MYEDELIGMRFGMLTVLRFGGKGKSGNALYLCRCDCGNEVKVWGKRLENGSITSCGCWQKKNKRIKKDG